MLEPAYDLASAILVLLAAGLVAGVVTGLGKPAVRRLVTRGHAGDPFWWHWGLRLASVLIGGVAGAAMTRDLPGLYFGLGGGLLCTVVVAGFKKAIATRLGT